ncbi:hypothetical protein F5887DRAFT_1069053 [Amanita rubescens]|nr:hypothetical protein F5887DRAFT_1069053 [Amanita rubescens]
MSNLQTRLSKRSTEVKNDWDNFVKMKVNECDQKIDKWQQSISQAYGRAKENDHITESINDLKAAVRNAQDTKTKLEVLLMPL